MRVYECVQIRFKMLNFLALQVSSLFILYLLMLLLFFVLEMCRLAAVNLRIVCERVCVCAVPLFWQTEQWLCCVCFFRFVTLDQCKQMPDDDDGGGMKVQNKWNWKKSCFSSSLRVNGRRRDSILFVLCFSLKSRGLFYCTKENIFYFAKNVVNERKK